MSSRLYPLAPAWPLSKPLPAPSDSVLLLTLLALLAPIAFVKWPNLHRHIPAAGGVRRLAGPVALAALVLSILLYAGRDRLGSAGQAGRCAQHLPSNHCFDLCVERACQTEPEPRACDDLRFVGADSCGGDPCRGDRGYRSGQVDAGGSDPGMRHRSGPSNHALSPSALLCAMGMQYFRSVEHHPLGQRYNTVVWPWNVAMLAFLALLFRRADNSPRDILCGFELRVSKGSCDPVLRCPAPSFFNLWDTYLSFEFYTGNRTSGRFT